MSPLSVATAVPSYARHTVEIERLQFHLFEGELPPLEPVRDVIDDGWGEAYVDRCWYRFDEPTLRWMLPTEGGHGIVVTDPRGDLIGCLIASRRRIRVAGRELDATFATGMTMLPTARSFDAPVALQRVYREYLADRHGTDVVVGIFDNGGLQGGTKVFERFLGGDTARRHLVTRPLTMWGTAADIPLCERYAPLEGAARIATLPVLRGLAEFKPSRADRATPVERVSAAALPPAPAGWSVATLDGPSLAEMYGEHQGDRAGLYRIPLKGGGAVHVAWSVFTLTRRDRPDGRAGHLQLVWPGPASTGELAGALRAVLARLFDLGCAFVTLLDSRVVPRLAMLRAGLMTSERRVQLSIDAPRGLLPEAALDGPLHFELL